MRTNVNIADDAREFAELYAHANGVTLGEAITELIRKCRQVSSASRPKLVFERSEAGFPMIPRTGRRITSEMVREAEEDDFV